MAPASFEGAGPLLAGNYLRTANRTNVVVVVVLVMGNTVRMDAVERMRRRFVKRGFDRCERAPLDGAGTDDCTLMLLRVLGWKGSIGDISDFSRQPPAARVGRMA